ncbi:PEP-CTERM sorting domain-containing protein [Aquincola sp. MAHUQ-54]|uniref:PEP-CTERM sorting domain-containing protein n=1 Tax=Aquincola agrisoli TaxID=3119538 RepID=A0AAW9QJT1_9BURK
MRLFQRLTALAWCALAAGAVHAAPVGYAGTLGSGTFVGTVAAESGPWGGAENWSFWQFTVPFLTEATITVTPTDAAFDPVIAAWYGAEGDTAAYANLFSGSANGVLVAAADGIGPYLPGGAGEPASISFQNLYGNGSFVLAIADYADGVGAGPLGYTITAAVPEPETCALMLAGIGLVAAMGRRRRG